MTAVDYLVKELHEYYMGRLELGRDDIIKKAKELEKKNKFDFAEKYEEYVSNSVNNNRYIQVKSAEQYYQETYASKGSETKQ